MTVIKDVSTALYKGKVYYYGEGYGEVSVGFVSPKKDVEKKERGNSDNQSANLKRAAIRAKSTVRRSIMAGAFDHLITLTVRENIESFDDMAKALEKFVRLVHEKYPDWKYVAVPERQKRGAWHFHVAVKGFQNLTFLRTCWYEALGGSSTDRGENTKGAINIKAPSNGSRGSGGYDSWKREKLASYLVKYLVKAFEDGDLGLNRQRYRVAKGIEMVVVPFEGSDSRVGWWALEGAMGMKPVFSMWHAELNFGWACTWGRSGHMIVSDEKD